MWSPSTRPTGRTSWNAGGRRVSCRVRCTLRAGALDRDRVRDVGKAMGACDPIGPLLDFGAFDLDGVTAVPADQVVMVARGAAPAVEHLAALGAHRVDLAALGQRTQL